jgi:hypothetical protein
LLAWLKMYPRLLLQTLHDRILVDL